MVNQPAPTHQGRASVQSQIPNVNSGLIASYHSMTKKYQHRTWINEVTEKTNRVTFSCSSYRNEHILQQSCGKKILTDFHLPVKGNTNVIVVHVADINVHIFLQKHAIYQRIVISVQK